MYVCTLWLIYFGRCSHLLYKWNMIYGLGITLVYMSHFSYSCKTERQNGISHLNSALCVNYKFTSKRNSGIFQKYSRNADYSTIWLCIWYGLLQKLEKSKIWPFCLHLNSQVPLNCKDTSRHNCWMLQKYFRMLSTQESGCTSGTDCFQNLDSSLKKSKTWSFYLEFNGQVLIRQG